MNRNPLAIDYSCNDFSFYRIFDFNHLMHDAVDYALTYEICTIIRDITTASGLQLKKGAEYETVYFCFHTAEFQFINWKRVSDYQSDPDETKSITIPQSELAPFLSW